ncbi:MAG: DUF4272 domain-containing protein [Paenibacillus macerans]|uniref:DUF4272 domain-containing protein n=1 Tax=Paenibacillus macerans TaxID=44252 RepID=A0A090Z9W1_PAEMA|nr:DUF4272 domain-containing protein [Paenibacillus macerans]KFN07005.1 hypothetical protein DJ90_4638 [Paenibacillus macerans]MBS5914483.1 DUF4272 domain-containing protein [Paenibacillus macerans]MCY7559700.1 DUF4272 domain-containing protein [Paenibacillus macerans]MDU7476753.1 DUF4272 domain-containing protein [Paenibacillus macerans]MEC0136250.1 DUF4272 domain-containing protein [Paenibacillus macerans]
MPYFTIFASRNDIRDIGGLIHEAFGDGFKITGGGPGETEFSLLPKGWFKSNKITIRVASEDTDPDYFDNNIPGMMGFYDSIPFEDEELKRRVLLQISVINTMLAIETEKEYGQDSLERFIKLAAKVDGIGFIPDGTLLDRDGRVIVYPDGRSDAADFSPRACTRKIRGEDRSTPEGAERKQSNLAYLKEKQIPYLEHLPELPPLSELKVKSREEIARRAAALLIVIQYACDVAQESDLAESKAFVTGLLDQFGVADELTEAERELLEQAEPARQDAINLTWQYEAYWALLWALGVVDSLDFPDHTCDCDFAIKAVSSCGGFAEFLERTSLRRPEEILDEADRIYRLHWACVNDRIQGREPAGGLIESVVMERRRGLFWMIGHRNEAWDDISMDT